MTGDLLTEAKAFAASVLNKPLEGRRLKNVVPNEAETVDKIYEGERKNLMRKFN